MLLYISILTKMVQLQGGEKGRGKKYICMYVCVRVCVCRCVCISMCVFVCVWGGGGGLHSAP